MPRDLFLLAFEHESERQEAYAREHGYFIDARSDAVFYVFKQGARHTLALCTSRFDAVMIAFALARTFSPPEGIQP